MHRSLQPRAEPKLTSYILPLALFAAGLSSCGGSDNSTSVPEQKNGWTREGPGYRVTEAEFKSRKLTWPFTVDQGVIGCDREALWFAAGGHRYALNGWAVHLLGYDQAYAIWKFDEQLRAAAEAAGVEPQARISIDDVQEEARKLCTDV